MQSNRWGLGTPNVWRDLGDTFALLSHRRFQAEAAARFTQWSSIRTDPRSSQVASCDPTGRWTCASSLPSSPQPVRSSAARASAPVRSLEPSPRELDDLGLPAAACVLVETSETLSETPHVMSENI